VNGAVEMILIPEMATEANRKVVMPPSTDAGIAASAAATLDKMPIKIKKKQAEYPAFQLTQQVRAITSCFEPRWTLALLCIDKPACRSSHLQLHLEFVNQKAYL